MSEIAVAEQVEEQEPQTEEQVEETQETEEPESFMDSLFQDLGVVQEETETPEEKGEQGEEEQEPEQETQEEEGSVANEAEGRGEGGESQEVQVAEEKPKKRVSYKAPKVDYEEIRRTVRDEVSRQRPTPTPPQQQQAQQPDQAPEEDTSSLVPEQLEELELARFAERKHPDKYKGQSKKLLDFYGKLDKYASESDGSFGDDDTDFQEFVAKHKPKLTGHKKLEREMIADLAAQQVATEKDSEINALKEKMRVLETKPTVEKKFSKFTENLKQSGETEDEFAQSIYKQQLDQAEGIGKEYLDLYYGMKTWDGSDSTQKWIVDFVTHQSNVFSQKGGNHLVRDNKNFMTPATYAAQGNPTENWTFGPDEVLQMFNNFFSNTAKKQVESEYERLEKMGFTKGKGKKSTKTGKVKEDAKPITTPKARTAKSPGAAESGGAEDISFGEDLVKTLGMDFSPVSTE